MFVSVALMSVTGCPGDDSGGQGEETGTMSGTETDPSTSITAPATSQTTTSATTASTSEDATGTESGVDDSTSTTDPSDGSSTGSAGSGHCAQSCELDADCCPIGAINCPSEDYPDNWSCTDGVCEFGGCQSNGDCALTPFGECHPVNDVGTCFAPCESDDDCLVGSCVGMADDDAMFCTEEPSPCAGDEDCGGLGVCDTESGACVCTSDRDCADDTFDVCVM